MKIFIDPGHGGDNPGAIAATGLEEATVNLDVSLRLGNILTERGYDVNYSRTTNINVSLAQRARLAKSKTCLFVGSKLFCKHTLQFRYKHYL